MEYYYWLCFSIVGGVLILFLIWRGYLNRVPKMTKLPLLGYQPIPKEGCKEDCIKPPPKKR